MFVLRIAVLVLAWSAAAVAAAQTLPAEPIALDDGRLTIGGEFVATIGSDDPGWFDYTDYDISTLRQVRASLIGAWRPTDHVALLGELRVQTGGHPEPYALYVRLRPWPDRRVDLQVGLVPPVFGAYARRTYGTDNPLIGVPLAYQYLTSLRTDAMPATADDLLRMRGSGWLSAFPVGNTTAHPGIPLVNGLRWDTGAQVHVGHGTVDAAFAVTTGSLSDPRIRDTNGGTQLSGRVEWRPNAGLLVGASAARGAYGTRALIAALPPQAATRALVQRAAGADIEYSRDHWLWRTEAVLSAWDVPRIRPPFIDSPLRALAVSTEGRYTIWPGAYVAARLEHLGFSRIAGRAGPAPWEAPVSRLELGGGYKLQRNLLLKAVYQQNRRDGTHVLVEHVGAAQVMFWF